MHRPPAPDANLARLLWLAADRHGDRHAIVERGRATGYLDLRARAAAFAVELRRRGVSRGDRVVVWLPRGVEAAAAYFGVLALGAVPVLTSEALRARQVAQTAAACGAEILVSSHDLLAPVAREGGWSIQLLDVRDVAGTDEIAPVAVAPSDLAQIVFTSGSTGAPKGVMLSHANLAANVQTVSGYLGAGADDRVAALLPFSSVYGLSQLLCSVAIGSALVIERSPLATRVAQTVAEERVTVLAAVPPLWMLLLGSGALSSITAPALRIVQNAGGHLPATAVEQIRRTLPRASLFLQYGMTEMLRSTFLPPEEVDAHPTSMGRPVPGAQVLVLREDGTPAAPGEIGELVHRGPSVALGYWGDPESTARTFRALPGAPAGDPERVVFSGDLVRRDADGRLYFFGRRDRLIKSMGHRVGPDEITDLLLASGKVAEATVSADPHERWGSEIVAHVVLAPGGTLEALREFARAEMPRHMQPRRFLLYPSLPRLSSGKLDLTAFESERFASAVSTG